jgi:hypothetical protein
MLIVCQPGTIAACRIGCLSSERERTLKPPDNGANWQLMLPNQVFEVISCQFALYANDSVAGPAPGFRGACCGGRAGPADGGLLTAD